MTPGQFSAWATAGPFPDETIRAVFRHVDHPDPTRPCLWRLEYALTHSSRDEPDPVEPVFVRPPKPPTPLPKKIRAPRPPWQSPAWAPPSDRLIPDPPWRVSRCIEHHAHCQLPDVPDPLWDADWADDWFIPKLGCGRERGKQHDDQLARRMSTMRATHLQK